MVAHAVTVEQCLKSREECDCQDTLKGFGRAIVPLLLLELGLFMIRSVGNVFLSIHARRVSEFVSRQWPAEKLEQA